MSTCIVHDGSVHNGGGTNVAIEAARALDADLVVGFSGMGADWWKSRAPNDIMILSHTDTASTFNDLKTLINLRKLDLDYDTVITSGPTAKFYREPDSQTRFHYIHHPPTSLLLEENGIIGFEYIDRRVTRSINHLIANSSTTRERVEDMYGIYDTPVVNPPVNVHQFYNADGDRNGEIVVVGRVEERKRPMLVVEVSRLIDKDIHMIGGGPLVDEVREVSPENLTVHGYVPKETLIHMLRNSYCGLFLAEREDFGITPIEYMASGLPVVGVDEPHTNCQISSNNGVLVDPDPNSVVQGIETCFETDWDRRNIADSTDMYRVQHFRSKLRDIVEQ